MMKLGTFGAFTLVLMRQMNTKGDDKVRKVPRDFASRCFAYIG